ncbi:MAG: hypothetical protein PHI33_09235 [Smithellaceae bacterium]|nr:hypothetical protein [Smithellaceae bacterium]
MKKKHEINTEYEKDFERIRKELINQTIEMVAQSMCQLTGHHSGNTTDPIIFRAMKGWIKANDSYYGRSLESSLINQLFEFVKYAKEET